MRNCRGNWRAYLEIKEGCGHQCVRLVQRRRDADDVRAASYFRSCRGWSDNGHRDADFDRRVDVEWPVSVEQDARAADVLRRTCLPHRIADAAIASR